MRLCFSIVFLLLCNQTLHSQIQYPDHIFGDTLNAPFFFGVASASPSQSELILWTKIHTELEQETLSYIVSSDEELMDQVASGEMMAVTNSDHTVHVSVDGLQPDTYYWYQFTDEAGNSSALGRTKTLPEDPEDLQFIIASCASIYSGYFNAYRHIAGMEDLDIMIHLGDYIYNDPDTDEQVRVPDPYPIDPETLEEWRDRHEYYLLDPDLRAARQMHPWIVLWDNHDMGNRNNPDDWAGSVQAFHEYVPGSQQDPNDPFKIYRSIEIGDLVDLYVVDLHTYKGDDIIVGEEESILGNQQYEWLTTTMNQSDAKWQLIANQNLMGHWSAIGMPTIIEYPTDGDVFDDTTWDGYFEDRKRLFEFWRENDIDNIMVLSGDAHLTFANDLIIPPIPESGYNRATGEAAHGVEVVITSLTRGNFDEEGYAPDLAEFATQVSQNINPHHLYNNFHDHGYALLQVKPDSITVEFWYTPILEISDEINLDQVMVLKDGVNHWERLEAPLSIASREQTSIAVYPNPVSDKVMIPMDWVKDSFVSYQVLSLDGRILAEGKLQKERETMPLQLPQTTEHFLLLQLADQRSEHTIKLELIQH